MLDPESTGNGQVCDADRSLNAGKSQIARARANSKAMRVFYEAYDGADDRSIKIDGLWSAALDMSM